MNTRITNCGHTILAVGVEGSVGDLTEKIKQCYKCNYPRTENLNACNEYRFLKLELDIERIKIELEKIIFIQKRG